jgi:putative hydrolase of the HAD superfamily
VALDHSAYSNSIVAQPDAVAALDEVRGAGYRTGLVSNVTLRASLMREDLDRTGLGRRLDATVFSSEVGVRKPDPRIFREAMERLGVDPPETVFVGDRLLDDITGAQAVGMRAIHTRQFRGEPSREGVEPDATIESIAELPAVLGRWASGTR